MIKNYLITGDCHGNFHRFDNIDKNKYSPEETAVICLGDFGINFYLNKTDEKHKLLLCKKGFTIYCVRGNHEERPENLSDIKSFYDENVKGEVWYQPDYPLIRYFKDGEEYEIEGYSILIIGGAYSVDKWYRLSHFEPDAKWTGWFKDEQLTIEEMNSISERFSGKHFDFILSHTCPASWQPFDLFLSGLDQSTVDKTMENWLEQFKDSVSWNVWCFGHFHDDRLVRPGVEMYFNDIEDINTIYKRWTSDEKLDWWLKKDPNFYMQLDKKEED